MKFPLRHAGRFAGQGPLPQIAPEQGFCDALQGDRKKGQSATEVANGHHHLVMECADKLNDKQARANVRDGMWSRK